MQQTINEERLLFEQNKNPFVFAKPNDPNLTANGGYDYQDDNQHGGNGYGHTDSQNGRYGYDHQAENQYGGNGYGQAGSQYGRYGYDHQPDYQYNGNGCSYRMISMVDVGIIEQIKKDMESIDASVAIKGIIFMVMVAT